ncbi:MULTISPECIES: RNA-binding protein [unclassified Pseudoclavibacter]|uniref:RNA-binding protein n=1 Tax=unclassified Pseudoclavibacter TaxID=2615177 RepID=UPI001BAB2254|nr:RNA-binding protein [Pseudoclavibacter sp. Marseille-Q4354]MBS3180143.1 RNA-binding protein [Pseudoclavibacter sp. Marseille-Q4354]
MGLKIPEDVAEWHRWQQSRSLKSRVQNRVRPSKASPGFVLLTNGAAPRLLVVIEAPKPSTVAAYAAPLRSLADTSVAVLAPTDVSGLLGGNWQTTQLLGHGLPEVLREVRAVYSAGNYLPGGALSYRWSQELGARFVVAQHGLMTPYAPPLAHGTHLLAFSSEDADFWKSGRTDVTHEVVGGQILWDAAKRESLDEGTRDDRPVFLGQLHGAELPRAISGGTAVRFCKQTGAEYRPHPAETDKLSQLQHRFWRARGVRFESSGRSLAHLNRPVVSVFSTGVLEAAAAGQPAWVSCVNAPEWVRDFWERYDLSEWGGDPTPAPPVPPVEPAKAIAASLARILEGTA